MPMKKVPKQCGCGCGQMTAGGHFRSGHDTKMTGAIVQKVGGVLELKALIEKTLNCKVEVNHEM